MPASRRLAASARGGRSGRLEHRLHLADEPLDGLLVERRRGVEEDVAEPQLDVRHQHVRDLRGGPQLRRFARSPGAASGTCRRLVSPRRVVADDHQAEAQASARSRTRRGRPVAPAAAGPRPCGERSRDRRRYSRHRRTWPPCGGSSSRRSPPIRIGRRALDGRRVVADVLTLVVRAAGGRLPPRSIARITSTASSSQSRRSPKPEPKSSPKAACSRSNQAPPMPEDGPPVAHVVERRGHLRGEGRVSERVRPDHQAERDPRRDPGPARQDHVALEDRPAPVALDRVEVVPGPQRVIAELVGALADAQERWPVRPLAPRKQPDLDVRLVTSTPSDRPTRSSTPAVFEARIVTGTDSE